MNFFKAMIVIAFFVGSIMASGSRPGAVEAYLMLARSDFLRTHLMSKLGTTNRATLKQRIQNSKFRSAMRKALNSIANNAPESRPVSKSNSRMNAFRKHHQ